MTIEKGRPWGEPIPPTAALARASSDRELATLAADAHRQGRHPIIELAPAALAGDVARTLGIASERPPEERLGYRFDLGFVELDDDAELPFVAHVSAHRRFWGGKFAVAMNCAWIGDRYLGPRAHPNDGLIDYTAGALSPVQRLLARQRVKTGSHLPHPDLSSGRSPSWEHRFDRPLPVFVDGRVAGRNRLVRVRVQADCFTVFV